MPERPGLSQDGSARAADRDFAAARFSSLQMLADDIEHEVRNLVQAASISLEILRRKSISLDTLSYADAVETELNRIERLVGSTLQLMRPDTDEEANQGVDAGVEIALPLLASKARVARIQLEYGPGVAGVLDPDATRESAGAAATGSEPARLESARTAPKPTTIAFLVLEVAGAVVEALRPDGRLRLEVRTDRGAPIVTIFGTGEREAEIRVSNNALFDSIGVSVSVAMQDDRHAHVVMTLPSASA